VHTVVRRGAARPRIPHRQIEAEIRDVVVKSAIPARWLDAKTIYLVNGTGAFTIGGRWRNPA